MNEPNTNTSTELLALSKEDLNKRERKVLEHILARRRISQNVNETYGDQMSFGDRLADKVAAFGGSWTFIILFFLVLMAWVLTNTALLGKLGAFDPYPFIFLNLVLSMIAAVQAPIIMIVAEPAGRKGPTNGRHDYEINMKAELEILALHEKLDDIRQMKLQVLMQQQEEQMKMLAKLISSAKSR